MFSPGTKRHNLGNRNERRAQTVRGSPVTPLSEIRQPVFDNSVPNRPSSGTPAPWTPRLSVLARISPVNRNDKRDEIDPLKPVYVGEFPQIVRDEQARLLQKFAPGDTCISGGLDGDTSLAWIICANKLFIWNYLLPIGSNKCVVLEIPTEKIDNEEIGENNSDRWLLSVVNWNSKSGRLVKNQSPVGIILCRKKTRVVLFWFDVFCDKSSAPLTYCASSNLSDSTSDSENNPRSTHILNRDRTFNSLIATAIPDSQNACIAFASSSNGELWQFHCTPTGIHCIKECPGILSQSHQDSDNNLHIGYPRSLIWGICGDSTKEVDRQFLLLTDHEIQCFNVTLSSNFQVSKLWSYEIIGTDSDLGIKKDLAGQKRIWPLYMQADENERIITILVATFCKDRVSNSSYIQYSFLIFQYKSKRNLEPSSGRVLEKKAPLQVIIPKARLEEEEFLFSLRLRVGGKPLGSTIILSSDGKATVSYYFRNSTRLYEFDLPFDAGKVVDASVFPSSEQGEDGAWVVMTEKAGIWTIPEKAVVLGGVEPPERSLSRKGSSNDRSSLEEKKDLSFAGNNAFGNANTELRGFGGKLKGSVAGNAHRAARDEESEALLRQLFHEFLVSGKVDASVTKLWSSEAFDRDGETNVFTRISKSIVDTLAKHWTVMRGDEIVAMTIVSNQLIDKRQKHQKFLQFLALSKCHEELCSRQRHSLQIILEHGEKLAAMIELRGLQNKISQNRSAELGSMATASEGQASGALWDVVQLVGDRARRNTVLLMDRDNAEVFYSKISDLDEVFNCLDRQLDYVLNLGQPFGIEKPRACELSNVCVSIINSAICYRSEHQLWYPPPEGLTPWYSQPMVRNGMWNVASFMLQLLNEAPDSVDISAISDLYSHLKSLAEVLLEAYAGAITAKAERGEEHKALLDEYWKRRDTLLNSLYRQIKCFANGGHKGMDEGIIELNEEVLRKHASELLPIAKRHECYSILWNICCDLNDLVLLKNLMHESMGPKGGFSYFVFEQLHKKRDFSKLLRLGEEFHEELSIYLKQHPDLLWLHELFLHQFSSASHTLHKLALWKDENFVFPSEEEAEPEDAHPELRLADKKRFLYLSKIAALAGKEADSESKLARIDADLKILKLQEEIVDLCHDIEVKQNADKELLSPQLLINLCLNAQDSGVLLKAFDVFAWTSTSFRKKHRKLLESCWKKAANQDDWNELYQTLVAEGWSDDETLQALRKTALFMASIKCYGPHAEIFGDGFEEVLPLRLENSISSVYPGASVEEILMQHKDFPEAGKLMLTAIELGGLEAHSVVENESSLME